MDHTPHLRNTFAEIDLEALNKNLRFLRSLQKMHSFFCPMVKANAYGHGDFEIVQELIRNDIQWLGVSLVEEGIHLRQKGILTRILTFSFFDKQAAHEVVAQSLTPVLSTWEQITELKAAVLKSKVTEAYNVHIKFDTGMTRLGFDINEISKISEYFQNEKHLKIEAICSHLFQSEDADRSEGATSEQVRLFEEIKHKLKNQFVFSHLSNSQALLKGPSVAEGVRPGIALYGGTEKTIPVMTLKSKIGLLRKIAPGVGVSYGHTWISKRDSLIGVIPIGYADGYQRYSLSQRWVLCKGCRIPVVGTVCMDYLMIDLTEAASKGIHFQVDDKVVLFGKDGNDFLSVEELAAASGTIGYELLTGLSQRIPRVYKGTK